MEGIIPALESSHAVAHAIKMAKGMDPEAVILVNLSGRGDKDIDYVLEHYPLVDYEVRHDNGNGFRDFLAHIKEQ